VQKLHASRWYRRRLLWLWSVAISALAVYVSLLFVIRIV
jgi:hypothetical protein